MAKEQQITSFFERHPELRLEQEVINNLIAEARRAREMAYVPYSGYRVGAAVLCESGEIYGGCNIENVTYNLADHAEQVAVDGAFFAGEGQRHGKFIKALVVVHEGDSMPCGSCRQRILEFCDDALIINANPEGKILGISCLSELLPMSFSPGHLGRE